MEEPKDDYARVDTLMAVIIAEDADRDEGWQYNGALLYDLHIPDTGPCQRVPMIGRIKRDSRAVDAMSNQDGIIINNGGIHLIVTGPGDGTLLMDVCRALIATDRANKGEVEPMGRQIYEIFLPCEVAGHCEAEHRRLL